MTDVEVTVNREVLRYAVQRAIFCPVTNNVLDVRRAVLVTISVTGQRDVIQIMTATAWDVAEQRVRDGILAQYPDATFEVLDGRELFGSAS